MFIDLPSGSLGFIGEENTESSSSTASMSNNFVSFDPLKYNNTHYMIKIVRAQKATTLLKLMPFYGTYNFAYLTSMEDRNDFILASSGVPSMIC